MVIGTLNLKNQYKREYYDGINCDGSDNIVLLKQLIEENQIDVLGVQELVRRYEARLRTQLNPEYHIVGDYRFSNSKLFQNIQMLNNFNESNAIITNQQIMSAETKHLPWIGTTLPRIATIANINSKELGEFVFINTHLDFLSEPVKIRQLKKLREIILSINRPVILTGDFNSEIKDDYFKCFVTEFMKQGLNRLPIDGITHEDAHSQSTLDHIFISSEFSCDDCGIIEIPEQFSDHNLPIAKIKRK